MVARFSRSVQLNTKYYFVVSLLFLFFPSCHPAKETFRNPLLSQGADPWCIYKNGYYYYTNTTGNNITIWKTGSIAKLSSAEKKIVFTTPSAGPYSHDIWAPEIHYLNGKWYIYFAADSGNNVSHRLWVLENDSKDPFEGSWSLKGKLTTPDDKWSIDGTVYEQNGKMYLLWSGWDSDINGQQNIYIASMNSPWSVEGKRVKLSSPIFNWEKNGDLNSPDDVPHVNVNEGPQILHHNGKLFLIYSASGCWTDQYALGMLSTADTSNLMDSLSWNKESRPVFTQNPEQGVYAPGHNSFFTSPDNKENWILYHANSKPGQGCGKQRAPRAQPFTFSKDGIPYFGKPVSNKARIKIPSGK